MGPFDFPRTEGLIPQETGEVGGYGRLKQATKVNLFFVIMKGGIQHDDTLLLAFYWARDNQVHGGPHT